MQKSNSENSCKRKKRDATKVVKGRDHMNLSDIFALPFGCLISKAFFAKDPGLSLSHVFFPSPDGLTTVIVTSYEVIVSRKTIRRLPECSKPLNDRLKNIGRIMITGQLKKK